MTNTPSDWRGPQVRGTLADRLPKAHSGPVAARLRFVMAGQWLTVRSIAIATNLSTSHVRRVLPAMVGLVTRSNAIGRQYALADTLSPSNRA